MHGCVAKKPLFKPFLWSIKYRFYIFEVGIANNLRVQLLNILVPCIIDSYTVYIYKFVLLNGK